MPARVSEPFVSVSVPAPAMTPVLLSLNVEVAALSVMFVPVSEPVRPSVPLLIVVAPV